MNVVHEATRSGVTSAASIDFAHLDLGGLEIAIAAENVVQAMVYPDQMTVIPRTQDALEGIFLYRKSVIPVVDLMRWVRPDYQRKGVSQLLVVASAERTFAIVIQAVVGHFKVAADAVQAVHHDELAHEFFHSVVLDAGADRLITLLDPARLALQTQVWTQRAGPHWQSNVAPGQAAETHHSEVSGSALTAAVVTDPYAVIQHGGHSFAFPVASVAEVSRPLPIQKMSGLSPFLGMSRWRDRDLAVFDLLSVLGLSAVPPTASRHPQAPKVSQALKNSQAASDTAVPTGAANAAFLVLQQGASAMGFAISGYAMVQTLPLSSIQADVHGSAALTQFAQGSFWQADGTRCILLDAQALLAINPLSGLVGNEGSAQGVNASTKLTNLASNETLVVLQSGQAWAVPMHAMREIVALPPGSSSANAVLEWRGQSVPVFDLRRLQQRNASVISDATRVVLTQTAAGLVGLLVEAVSALIPAHTGQISVFQQQGVPVQVVTTGHGAQQQSVQILPPDLLDRWLAQAAHG